MKNTSMLSPFMKISLLAITILVCAIAVTESGALFQSTVGVGSGSFDVSIAPVVPDKDHTTMTIEACLALAQAYNNCKNKQEKKELLGAKSASSVGNDELRYKIAADFGGSFLSLETSMLEHSLHLDGEELYINPYFILSGDKVSYIILYTSPNKQTKGSNEWAASAVYYPYNETWYEYIHDSWYGLFYETISVSLFRYTNKDSALRILENDYTMGTDWLPFNSSAYSRIRFNGDSMEKNLEIIYEAFYDYCEQYPAAQAPSLGQYFSKGMTTLSGSTENLKKSAFAKGYYEFVGQEDRFYDTNSQIIDLKIYISTSRVDGYRVYKPTMVYIKYSYTNSNGKTVQTQGCLLADGTFLNETPYTSVPSQARQTGIYNS